jgi:hypothetical protein
MTTESSALGAFSENAFAPRPPQLTIPLDEPVTARRDLRSAEPATVIISPEPDPDSEDVLARALLEESKSTPKQNALRLACGAAGTMLLQAGTNCAFSEQPLVHRLEGPPGLALAAATTLVIGLPGTLILLTALGSPPSFHRAWCALLRAYAQVGLLAGGFAPLVALFALTGGSPELVIVLSFVTYALAGTVALWGLARRVVSSAGELSFRTFVAGAGFLAFTLAVGLYLWVQLMEVILP